MEFYYNIVKRYLGNIEDKKNDELIAETKRTFNELGESLLELNGKTFEIYKGNFENVEANLRPFQETAVYIVNQFLMNFDFSELKSLEHLYSELNLDHFKIKCICNDTCYDTFNGLEFQLFYYDLFKQIYDEVISGKESYRFNLNHPQ